MPPRSSPLKAGPYELLALIGEGGMGEVYRARDPRLGRDVAIKFSKEQFTERFEREARAVAALNHANICQIFDVGPNYLVMEYIEGESPTGPLPLDEALRIARQIADALEAAHERGIVHRDLKPANIKIKPDGSVKVLDFGLATSAAIPAADPAESPTMLSAHTHMGMILGTAAYMSPEQARGKPVDKRADIWSFGVILHELLTGEKLFKGDTTTDVLAAVVKDEPVWAGIPASVLPLLKRCLEKDPKKRLRDIGDASTLIEIASQPAVSGVHVPPPRRNSIWPAVAALCFIAAGILGWDRLQRKSVTSTRPVLFQIPLSLDAPRVEFDLSPDGRNLAFIAQDEEGISRIWVRPLDSLDARPLRGTESTGFFPIFWSPDSRYIGFGMPSKLMKIDINGGPPQTICDVRDGNAIGGAWNSKGVIVFGTNAGRRVLMRVDSGGGVPEPVTTLDTSHKDIQHDHPFFLPDGRHFIYSRLTRTPEYTGLYLASLDERPERQSSQRLVATATSGAYLASTDGGPGHILFLRDRALMAQQLRLSNVELYGEPTALAHQVGTFADRSFFSAAPNGVLVYRNLEAPLVRQLTWLDRRGNTLNKTGEPAAITHAVLSPDGHRALETRSPSNVLDRDLWLRDFSTGSAQRLSFAPLINDYPVWSPDGIRIVFAANRTGSASLYLKPADGSKDDELILQSAERNIPTSWSRDGRFLMYAASGSETGSDLWILENPGSPGSKPQPFLRTEFNESEGAFSPDSRWVAYTSDESGRAEVYVRTFPATLTGGKWLVSNGGGATPAWRADGRELFYLAPGGVVMSLDVMSGSGTFQAGSPKELFHLPAGTTLLSIAADGQKFLASVALSQQGQRPPFTVLLNAHLTSP